MYEEQADWHNLEAVLALRAGFARTDEERSTLLHRRGRILHQWLHNPDEAAHAFKEAYATIPTPGLAEDLVNALIDAGRQREAAEVLEARLETLRSSNAGEGDVAAYLIRLATIRVEHWETPKPHG